MTFEKKNDETKKKNAHATTVNTIYSRIFRVGNNFEFLLFIFCGAYGIRLKFYIPRLVSAVVFCRVAQFSIQSDTLHAIYKPRLLLNFLSAHFFVQLFRDGLRSRVTYFDGCRNGTLDTLLQNYSAKLCNNYF